MKKSLATIPWIAIVTFLLSACNLGASGTPDAAATLNPLYGQMGQGYENVCQIREQKTGEALLLLHHVPEMRQALWRKQ